MTMRFGLAASEFLRRIGGTMLGDIIMSSGTTISWDTMTKLSVTADGKVKITNSAGTQGVVLDVSAGAWVLRNLSDNAQAAVTCGDVTVGAASTLSYSGRSQQLCTADGKLKWTNAGATQGVVLDFSASTFVLRNLADNAAAAMTAAGISGSSITGSGTVKSTSTSVSSVAAGGSGGGVSVGTTGSYNFTNNTAGDAGSVVAKLDKPADGVVRITDGSTGAGALLRKRLVEANTAGTGSPNVLVALESDTVLTNEGTTALNQHTLPTAVAGLTFTFVVQDADGIRVVAPGSATLRDGASVSAAGGRMDSTTIGSAITVVAINTLEWVVVAKQGTWTVT